MKPRGRLNFAPERKAPNGNSRLVVLVAATALALGLSLALWLWLAADKAFVVTLESPPPDTRLSLAQHENVPATQPRIELRDIPKGEHTLTVQAPAHLPYKTRVTVNRGGAGSALVRLEPVRGKAIIDAQLGTTITAVRVDGHTEVFTTQGPDENGGISGTAMLPVGAYTFRLTHPSYAPEELAGEVSETRLFFGRVRQSYENSLGMRFLATFHFLKDDPIHMTSIWETREQDYAAFVQATGHPWQSANAGPDHPAVNVSWEDANAFCAWLTQTERAAGKIAATQSYRLPTDHEWSFLVGLRDENPSASPAAKHARIKGSFRWGRTWPPPPSGSGNYADRSAWEINNHVHVIVTVAGLYEDGYARTSPVGTFPYPDDVLYDLSGNVWEWVEDKISPDSPNRTGRGGSFLSGRAHELLWSGRGQAAPDYRGPHWGFRVILTTH